MNRVTVKKGILLITACVMILISCTPEREDNLDEFLDDVSENIETFNIAFMGDSYAAGEGNPNRGANDTSTFYWSNLQCHRSFDNGRSSAVYTLNQQDLPLFEIQSFDAACSGATIAEGVLGPYRGLATSRTPFEQLEPQLDQVKDWLQSAQVQGPKKLDALVISIGGNDIGFGEIVGKCISGVEGPCYDNFDLQDLFIDGSLGDPAVTGFNKLDEGYERLDERIREAFDPVPLVILVGVPDPLRNEDEEYCDGFNDHFAVRPEHLINGDIQPTTIIEHWLPLNGQMRFISQDENEFMFNTIVHQLNEKMEEAADNLGWIYIGGLDELTRRHGYCSIEPWFNTLKDSFAIQGDANGSVHPNNLGYFAYEQVVIKALVENLHMLHSPKPAIRNDPFLVLLNNRGREVNVESEVSYPGTPTRVRVTVFPTANTITSVALEYSVNLPRNQAFAPGSFSTVNANNDGRFVYDGIYSTDIPETQLHACDWVHYRWRVNYSWNGETGSVTNRTDSYRIVSNPSGELHAICDPIPGH